MGNVGSVATIYSRKLIPYVLAWLKEDETLPFDHVYNHLAKIGIPIRTAEPNLVILSLTRTPKSTPAALTSKPALRTGDMPCTGGMWKISLSSYCREQNTGLAVCIYVCVCVTRLYYL